MTKTTTPPGGPKRPKILIKLQEDQGEMSEHGFYIPPKVDGEKDVARIGKVIKTYDGCKTLKSGDTVFVSPYQLLEMVFNKETFHLISEADIFYGVGD